MAPYKDELTHHDADGIQEYDNPMPGWLLGILWSAIVFGIVYIAFYALAFAPASMAMEYRGSVVTERAELQAYFNAHPLVPPQAEDLLAGAVSEEIVARGAARFVKTCAPCHGEQGQGLIGPNLTDDRWLHGGQVTSIFTTVAKGVPAKGMPPWGRAIAPDEIAAVVSFIRSIQGTTPAGAKPPEGDVAKAEPLPAR